MFYKIRSMSEGKDKMRELDAAGDDVVAKLEEGVRKIVDDFAKEGWN